MSEDGRRFGSWTNPSWWNLVVFVPWLIGLVCLLYAGISDLRVSKREQTVEGVITAHEARNHDRYGYVFSVGGKSYTGWESPGNDGWAIGQHVVVYYDPGNPSTNALSEYGELGFREFGPIPFMLVVAVGIGLAIWRARRKNLESTRSH